MNWQILKDVLIPILTVIISGLSAYVGAKRGRTAAFREKIFSKQLDAVSELTIAINDVFRATSNELGTSWDNFRSIRTKWSVYLPQNVEEKLGSFAEAAVGTMKFFSKNPIRNNPNWPANEYQKIYEKLFESFIEVNSALRELVGTEPLTRETIQMYRLEPHEKSATSQKQLE